MAGAWLVWSGGAVALALATLLTIAGAPLVGLFLGAVVWWAARSAVAPDARADADAALLRACDRLPFCGCARRRGPAGSHNP